ncbi:MAG: outer membrane protein assembly factor BamA [Candidatus Hydrogenedentota bacterium]
MRKIIFYLCALISINNGLYSQDDPRYLEAAAISQEDAAKIREELGDVKEASKLYNEAASIWERAAKAYENQNNPDKARYCWDEFKKTAELAEKLKIKGRLEKISGDFQEVVVTEVVEQKLIIQLKLEGNITPEGYKINFSIIDTPKQAQDFKLSEESVICDKDGYAGVFFTAGNKAGIYRIQASTVEIKTSPIIFEIQAVPSEASILSYVDGNNQIVRANEKSPKPMEVSVTDLYGNRIIGVPVEFKIIKIPEDGVGFGVSADKTLTGITAVARSDFIAGDKEGECIVHAINEKLDGSPIKFNFTVVPSIPRVVIREIYFEGNKTVHNSVLEEALTLKVGDEYLITQFEEAVAGGIKDIYHLGSFEEVQAQTEIEANTARVKFLLTEYPRIAKICFRGNDKLKEDKLKESITLSEGQFYSPYRMEKTIKELKKAYAEKGFIYVDIEALEENRKEDKIDVVFNIFEGIKVKITRFNIHGNKAFSTMRLNWEMKTGKGKVYSKETFDVDRERVLLKYAKKGYITATIDEPVITYNKDHTEMYVDVYINEGKRYKMGKLSFEGMTVFSENTLLSKVKLKEGEIFNQEKFREDIMNIQDAYSEKGYIFARILPKETLDKENGIIHLVIQIEEGAVAYIEKIIITGNIKTKEKVIKRELLFKEGEIFNGVKVRESRRNLVNLGFFDEVNIKHNPGTKEGYQIIEIEVKEGKTGQANFGAGYSSQDGFVGFIQITKKNFDPKDFWSFTGAGQNISVSSEFGGKRSSFSINWGDPHFRDSPYSLNLSGFNTTQEKEGYDINNSGGSIGVGRQWGKDKDNRIYGSYQYDDVTIDNITPGIAPTSIVEEAGSDLITERAISSITVTFTRDKRDNFFFPTQGYRLMLTNEVAGYFLGGDEDFDEFQIEGRWFKNFISNQVFAVRARYGIIGDISGSDTIPSFRRFYIGGQNTVRGFRDRQIAIRSDTGVILGGGAQMFYLNLEYRIPIVEKLFSVVVFADAGTVWSGFGKSFDSSDIAYGAGLGMRISTPLGPIRLDFSRGLSDPNKGNTEVYFGIGESF